jgi:uncharacterized peroxidase-related enzyme
MARAERPLTLPARTESDTDPAVAAVLARAKAEQGKIFNMYARMANAPALLQTYFDGYTAFRNHSGFSPTEQEVILLTISRVNGCDYCVAAHSTVADMNKIPTEVTDAIRDGKPVPDPRLAALSTFTADFIYSRGALAAEQVDAFVQAGFTEADILNVLLAISVKTISNYANSLFHTPVDAVFAARTWEE